MLRIQLDWTVLYIDNNIDDCAEILTNIIRYNKIIKSSLRETEVSTKNKKPRITSGIMKPIKQ